MNGWKFKTVTIIVPTKDRDGNLLPDHETDVQAVVAEMVDHYGGATATKAQGAWKDPETGNVHLEDCTRVESWVDPGQHQLGKARAWSYCKTMARVLNQAEVALIIDGTYYGVKGE